MATFGKTLDQMKQIRPLLLIATLFILVTAACKKSSTTTPSPTATVGMTFTFNGIAETSNLVLATWTKSLNSIQIIGSNGTQGLNLMFSSPKVGTFDIATDPTIIASFSTATDFNHTYFGSTGKIVITTFTSDTIAGTFQFSGANALSQAGVITNGTFTAKLTTY